jgi:hypothetical protein
MPKQIRIPEDPRVTHFHEGDLELREDGMINSRRGKDTL